MAVSAFVAMAIPLSAGKPLPNRWATTELGYTGSHELAGYTAVGLALWSSSSGIRPYAGGEQIRVVYGPLIGPVYHQDQAAQANLTFDGSGNIVGCEVRVVIAEFLALNEFGRQNVITHELGHCLGLDHSDVPSVMMNPRFYSFSSDDAETVRGIYPPPGGVSQAQVSAPAPAPAAAQVGVSNRVAVPAPLASDVGVVPVAAAAAVATPPPGQADSATYFATSASDPRPYAGALEPGWNFVVWTGDESEPSA
jgi:hypothetical protein